MKKTVSRLVAFALFLTGSFTFAQTQIELTEDAGAALKKADAALNDVYKQVMAVLPEEQKALFKESQRAWIAYRDLGALSEGALYEGGSMQPMVQARAGAELTMEKTARLRAMLPDAVKKAQAALPKLEEQKAKLSKADGLLNRIYKTVMKPDFDAGLSKAAEKAEVAWLKYRDLCVKAESALYPKESAPVVAAKITTELTEERIAHLKNLFMEGYDDEGEGT